MRVRRWAYRRGWLSIRRVSVPVLVVGNVTLGGTGKTPLILWLVEWLRQAQYQPGVVSRGYGAESGEWPRAVLPESDPQWVGDEPVLIARRARCPMMVGPDRVAAAEALLHVLMTEKDAVKCQRLAHSAQGAFWFVPVRAVPDEAFGRAVLGLLEEKHQWIRSC